MKKIKYLTPEFVDVFPGKLETGKLYISMRYASAAHKCCCGCGNDVITPFSPKDWTLVFDGQTISISPSIGNWSFPCRSHYYIRHNNVIWIKNWSPSIFKSDIQKENKRSETESPLKKWHIKDWFN